MPIGLFEIEIESVCDLLVVVIVLNTGRSPPHCMFKFFCTIDGFSRNIFCDVLHVQRTSQIYWQVFRLGIRGETWTVLVLKACFDIIINVDIIILVNYNLRILYLQAKTRFIEKSSNNFFFFQCDHFVYTLILFSRTNVLILLSSFWITSKSSYANLLQGTCGKVGIMLKLQHAYEDEMIPLTKTNKFW